MSDWLKNLRSASFRGVPFRVVEAPEIEIGRRSANHEYAGRDEPYSEDMGRKQRSYSIEGAVEGRDFIEKAGKLQDAFEQEGAGVLVHPHYGELNVSCEATIKYLGRYATFVAVFKEAGTNANPTSKIDTAQQVQDAALIAEQAALSDFLDSFDLSGPAFITNSALEKLEEIAESFDSLINRANSLITQPSTVAAQVFSLVKTDSNSSVSELNRLADTSESQDYSTETIITPSQQSIANNSSALSLIVDQAKAISGATTLLEMDFIHQKQAQATVQKVAAFVESVSWQSTDNSYQALFNLRIKVQQHMQNELPKLPDIHKISLAQTMPSLVIAYQHGGGIDQEPQIVERNAIVRPGFVSGELEIVDA